MVNQDDESYSLTLETIPKHVYKENDGVISKGSTESWLFHILAREKYAQKLEPEAAVIQLCSGSNVVKTVQFSSTVLRASTCPPEGFLERFVAKEQVLELRHHFSEPVSLEIDRLEYQLDLKDARGVNARTRLHIPVLDYHQSVRLVFPITGNFVVAVGHDFNEPHTNRLSSQHHAYDILGLGPSYELARNQGKANEDFFGWGREVLVPANGQIAYAREDVPDNSHPGSSDRDSLLKLRDPLWALAGNCVAIDHGNSEYSLLAHLQKGSVTVSKGDDVKQNDVVGRLGNSGVSLGPHLHYQLTDGVDIYGSDGLPSRFDNIEMPTPRRGVFLEAR